MTETLIYDALDSGTDNANIGVVIVAFILTGLFIYVALVLRSSRLKGKVFNSRSPVAMAIWTRVGNYPFAAIAIACILCLGISAPPLFRFTEDALLLARGGYSRWTGTVAQYTALRVTTQAASGLRSKGFAGVAGVPPTLHERDELTVDGRIFFVLCELPPETRPTAVGGTGKCLRLQAGRRVEVEYVQISPTEYRNEPLRIELIEP